MNQYSSNFCSYSL